MKHERNEGNEGEIRGLDPELKRRLLERSDVKEVVNESERGVVSEMKITSFVGRKIFEQLNQTKAIPGFFKFSFEKRGIVKQPSGFVRSGLNSADIERIRGSVKKDRAKESVMPLIVSEDADVDIFDDIGEYECLPSVEISKPLSSPLFVNNIEIQPLSTVKVDEIQKIQGVTPTSVKQDDEEQEDSYSESDEDVDAQLKQELTSFNDHNDLGEDYLGISELTVKPRLEKRKMQEKKGKRKKTKK